ncbi:MAG: GNAT family N-acetyltransferase [Candidatus Heimdallarchaeota archaeon]
MTIKRLDKEPKNNLSKLWYYCFADPTDSFPSTPSEKEEWDKYFDIINLKSSLGFYENGKLASTYVIVDYNMFVRGTLMKMGGIAAVASRPEQRKKGHVSALLTESLKVMRENNQYISVLYPFKFSFYRRYGYVNCAEYRWVISTPRNILLPKDFQSLEVREITHDESYDIVHPIRKKIGQKYNFVVFDDAKSWKYHNLGKKSIIYVISENGENVGYFIFNREKTKGRWDIRLKFRDVVIDSHRALLTVFDFIKKHTDQSKDFRMNFIGKENFTEYFDNMWDGDDFNYHESGGPMFRVIDVEKAIESLEFDKDFNGSFSLKVNDEYAPWNNDYMNVEIVKGKAKVSRAKEQQVDLQADIKAFTQLFVGYRSIYELEETNKVTITDNSRDKLNTIFPKRITRLHTSF